MSYNSLSFETNEKKIINSINLSKSLMTLHLGFEGFNEEIIETYYWFFNFAYYTGKAYTTFKLEDYHHFSEASQYGMNFRQIKGGSIRAFQENLNQLINLVKMQLMPLLKEVKQADFYHRWITNITKYDNLLQSETDETKKQEYRQERDEAISHLKDEWVSKVDGGRLWAVNRPATEQGLDFALLPQLFFGTNIDDPLGKRKSIKEQLDETIYEVDISEDAKSQTARFLYRFYTWLPSAIRDTEVTFKLKISTLKQLYSNVQMQINFMKPLLIEISKKAEGFDSENYYHKFTAENPDFVNLFDTSYFFVRTLGVRNFAPKDRGKWEMEDLEFTPYGLYLRMGDKDIYAGPQKGKKGFIAGEEDGKYIFYPSDKKEITQEEFEKLEKTYIDTRDLATFPIIELEFKQTRRTEYAQTPQGPQPTPYMKNIVKFHSKAWNIVEVATYRNKLKEENLELLESFIQELKIVKDDLMYYVNNFQSIKPENNNEPSSDSNKKDNKSKSSKSDNTIFTGPFTGFYELFSPLIPSFSLPEKKSKPTSSKGHPKQEQIDIIKMSALEDAWKIYTIYKKTHGYMQW